MMFNNKFNFLHIPMFRHVVQPFHTGIFIFWISRVFHTLPFHIGSCRQLSGKPMGAVLSVIYSSMSFTMRTGQDVPGLMSFRRYANITRVLYILRSALGLNCGTMSFGNVGIFI